MDSMKLDFDTLKKEVTADWKAQSKWREQAEDDYAFVAGHQWEGDEKADLEEKNRAPVVFNRVAVIISAVAGSEINNRTEVRFIPREIGDAKPNEVLTAGAEWFRDQSDAEDAESESFEDLLICGLGFTETSLDFEVDSEGQPICPRIDPLEMCWDRSARDKGLKNSRRFARVRRIPTAEAEDMFPGKSAEDIDCTWLQGVAKGEMGENNPGDQYADGDGEVDGPRDEVTVVQVQYCVRERSIEYLGQDGQRETMPTNRWDRIAKSGAALPPHRRITQWVWRQAFLGATEVLSEQQPDPQASTIVPMTGHWDRKEKLFYGLLRSMRDPQKYANKWLSQTLHIINSNAKGGVMYEAAAVNDAREFEESWAAADAATEVQRLSGIQEKPKAQIPAAFMGLTEFAISSIRDASGVNMELLGLRDQNQPGILEHQRKQAAMTTLSKYFDALRFYRKRQGQVLLHFLTDHIAPTGRLVRIVKDGDAQYVPLAVDAATKKFDVIVDDAPSSTNEKERSWAIIQSLLPLMQEAGLSLEDWAKVLEYSPLPSSFVEMVKQKAEDAKRQGQDPMQALMQELAIRKEQSEIAENMSNAQLDNARMQQIATETQLAPAKVAADLYQPIPLGSGAAL